MGEIVLPDRSGEVGKRDEEDEIEQSRGEKSPRVVVDRLPWQPFRLYRGGANPVRLVSLDGLPNPDPSKPAEEERQTQSGADEKLPGNVSRPHVEPDDLRFGPQPEQDERDAAAEKDG